MGEAVAGRADLRMLFGGEESPVVVVEVALLPAGGAAGAATDFHQAIGFVVVVGRHQARGGVVLAVAATAAGAILIDSHQAPEGIVFLAVAHVVFATGFGGDFIAAVDALLTTVANQGLREVGIGQLDFGDATEAVVSEFGGEAEVVPHRLTNLATHAVVGEFPGGTADAGGVRVLDDLPLQSPQAVIDGLVVGQRGATHGAVGALHDGELGRIGRGGARQVVGGNGPGALGGLFAHQPTHGVVAHAGRDSGAVAADLHASGVAVDVVVGDA